MPTIVWKGRGTEKHCSLHRKHNGSYSVVGDKEVDPLFLGATTWLARKS
jgi:hypothetical protein